jgi:hypothetical protein
MAFTIAQRETFVKVFSQKNLFFEGREREEE